MAHSTWQRQGRRRRKSRLWQADERGSGARDSVCDRGGVEGVAAVVGAAMAAAASVEGTYEHTAAAVIQAELRSEFEAGDRTVAGENNDKGQH